MLSLRSIFFGVVSLAVVGGTVAAAQQDTTMPKVLYINREYVKLGKGTAHSHTESAFVDALRRAKSPEHYIALSSITGKNRVLYISGHDSFDAMQKSHDSMSKYPGLEAELTRNSIADDALLDNVDHFIFYYDDDLSLNPRADLSSDRFMEITAFHVRPGHAHEFSELVKMVIAAHKKAGTNANWAMYELTYGGGDTYTMFSADKSMAEIDEGFAEGKKFRDAVGDEGMKKLSQSIADCVESSDSELFAINPAQSYPPDAWVKADPGFWQPKSAAPAKPAAAKKAKP